MGSGLVGLIESREAMMANIPRAALLNRAGRSGALASMAMSAV